MKIIFLILSVLMLVPGILSIFWLIISIKNKKNKILFLGILLILLLSFVYKLNFWFFINYYLKYINILLIVSIVLVLFKYLRISSFRDLRGSKVFVGIFSIVLLILVILNIYIYFPDKKAEMSINLQFPFKNGEYKLLQYGGNNIFTNYSHLQQGATLYAIDIVRISKYGFISKSLFSNLSKDYYIFNDTLYSPCNGKIFKIIDSVYDNVPFYINRSHTTGNHIIIRKDSFNIYLAHFKEKGIFVNNNDSVFIGQPIGLIGNSGNSITPHLHIHCTVNEEPENILGGIPVKINFQIER